MAKVNSIGLVAGPAMMVLPFLGHWWKIIVGKDFINLSVSPFSFDLIFLGEKMIVPLVWYVILGAKIAVLVAGASVFVGSLLPERWWSKHLVYFGATKVLWMVVGFIMLNLISIFIANDLLAKNLQGLRIPYLQGDITSIAYVSGATITARIASSFTNVFLIAVVIAMLGVATRVCHKYFARREYPKQKLVQARRVRIIEV